MQIDDIALQQALQQGLGRLPTGGTTALVGDVRPVGGLEARQDLEQGALTGAVASGQHDAGPRRDVEFRELEQAVARDALAQVGKAQQGGHGLMVPLPCRKLRAKFRTRASTSRTRPRAMPWANSLLLVSRAMAVGMLRV